MFEGRESRDKFLHLHNKNVIWPMLLYSICKVVSPKKNYAATVYRPSRVPGLFLKRVR